MGAITNAGNTAFRDYTVDGVPASGANEPDKTEIRALVATIDVALSSVVDGTVIGAAVVYSTRAGLYADLAHLAGVLGVVYGDGTAAYNGVYVKAGGSGSGSWSITNLALPSTFAADLASVVARLDTLDGVEAEIEADRVAALADIAAAEAASIAAVEAEGDAQAVILAGLQMTDQELKQAVELGGAPLPLTPYASWYPLDGDADLGFIPNRSTAVAAPKNLLRYVKGENYNGAITGNGVTLTVAGGVGPEGQTTALRAVSTNANGLTQMSAYLRAGTYTFSFEARAHDHASSYTDTIVTGAVSNPITVGAAWATHSQTFTVGAPGVVSLWPLWRNTTGHAYDIDLDNIRLHVGAVDLGVDAPGGHLLIGSSAHDTANPDFADFTTRNFGVADLPVPKAFTEFTIVVAVKQVGATGGTPAAYLSGDNYTLMSFGSQANLVSGRVSGILHPGGVASVADGGWMVHAYRVRDGYQDVFVNDDLLGASTTAFAGYTTSNLFQGINGGAGANLLPVGSKVGPVLIFDQFLTVAQVSAATASVRDSLRASGHQDLVGAYTYHAFGDSLTADNVQIGADGVGSYARRMFVNNPGLLGEIPAVVGAGLDPALDVIRRRLPGFRAFSRAGGMPIASMLIGANNPGPIVSDPNAYYERLKLAWTMMRNAGAKVIAITLLPQANAPFNAGRAIVNQRMRDDPDAYDALADLDATPAGLDGAPAAGVYYFDFTVHLSGLGYDVVTPVVQAAFDEIVATK